MKLKVCEIVQQLEYLDMETVKRVLEEKKCIKEYAYILHNEDVSDKGEKKAPHLHICLRFDNSYDTKHIGQWFGVPEQYIAKAKGQFVDMLKYLTHSNAKEKHQYNSDDIVSNFDVVKFIEENGNKKGRPKKKEDLRKKEIIENIVNGTIREYNYNKYITAEEYCDYKTVINDSFKYRVDKLMNEGVEKEMECIFITGLSGCGKTTYAKKIAKDKGYSYYVSSSKNDPLDNYKGQDVIILDELRPNTIDLDDLLKLLDNNTSSTVKSRFKNKYLECKLIIITTVMQIEDFYCNFVGSEKEPIEQFKRRCKTYVNLISPEEMIISAFDYSKMDYGKSYRLQNPVMEYFLCSLKDEKEQLMDMLGILNIDTEEELYQLKLAK